MKLPELDPLLDPEQLQRFLRSHHLPPLHRFGQHFLVDEGVLHDMVAASGPDPLVPVIEVGAGLGVLTRALARARQEAPTHAGPRPAWEPGAGVRGQEKPAPLIAVDLDGRLIPLLKKRVAEFEHVRVVHADILRTSVESLLPPASFRLPQSFDVIGNIPYNISGVLLKRLLTYDPRPRRTTLLMDASVVEGISAAPPAMSVRAVSVQVFAEPRIVRGDIPPSSFVPLPAVRSAIVTMTTRTHAMVPAEHERAFFRLVRAGFSQKRKVLANALSATYRIEPAVAAQRVRGADIDPHRRAQTLSIEEWVKLLEIWER